MAAACWIQAVIQYRMFLIYGGKLDSPTTGFYKGQGSNPHLQHIAIRSSLSWAIFGIVFLFVKWPQLLSWITGLWAMRSFAIDGTLLSYYRGVYGFDAMTLTPQGLQSAMREQRIKQVVIMLVNFALFGICIYNFGLGPPFAGPQSK